MLLMVLLTESVALVMTSVSFSVIDLSSPIPPSKIDYPEVTRCAAVKFRAKELNRLQAAAAHGAAESSFSSDRMCRDYFSSASVEVAGPSPMISSTASSSLAPSQCTCLPKCVTKLPVGIGVVLAGSNFGPEPTHQVPCRTTIYRSLGWKCGRLK